ncbi:MAG: LacI family DNA-binding transcriptional regulator [Galactobacter sp.]
MTTKTMRAGATVSVTGQGSAEHANAAGNARKSLGLRDIAKLAGVSHQTVSRVLNDHPNTSEATRAKVMKVVEENNYRPSRVARALATSRHQRIGAVVEGVGQTGPASTLRSIESAAFGRDYTVSTLSVGDGLTVSDAAEHLMDHGVDGLIVIAPRAATVRRLLERELHLPYVVVNAEQPEAPSTVSVDQIDGARQAVSHLLDAGHRVIMHIAGPLDWADARARERGWRDTLVANGAPVVEPVAGDWTPDSGYAAVARVLAQRDCTAVFAANDQMALGLIHGLYDAGIRVPQDVSVVGFDDLPESAHYLPPLTTIRQDFAALGSSAVGSLLDQVEHPGREVPGVRVRPRLVTRSSTARPRG